MHKLSISENCFILDGKPFTVVAGAIHYFRVPREYWRDRLIKIKACGFNTVETYTAWNLHEPEEGVFDFSNNLDLGAYLDLIAELGMFAIVRPGPYICSEWDFGGLPWWLLRYPEMQLRCADTLFLEKTESYFQRLLPIIAARQMDCGGPVIMVQVENEYGSYGNDNVYVKRLSQMLNDHGITALQFTSDGGSDTMLSGGSVSDILAACNFGSKPAQNFKALRKFQKTGPLFCAEFWNGWFDHWGEKHHTRSAQDAADTLGEILDLGASVSVYMAHGGTNFGWMNGANLFEEYQPTVNSYDDDAPIDESGKLTEKYYKFRDVLRSRGFSSDTEIPTDIPAVDYGALSFTRSVDLFKALPSLSHETYDVSPKTMEQIGQGYGLICYQTIILGPKEKDTLIFEPHDRAYVFLNGTYLGTYYRNDKKHKISFSVPKEGTMLTILVENMGRVNYGPGLADKKGIVGGVRFGKQFIYHWKHFPLPLDNVSEICFEDNDRIKFRKTPLFLQTVLKIYTTPGDTFVKLPGFRKGLIFVNGKMLSRYWEIGPQRSAYLPACFLREGENLITVLEFEGFKNNVVYFSDTPDLG